MPLTRPTTLWRDHYNPLRGLTMIRVVAMKQSAERLVGRLPLRLVELGCRGLIVFPGDRCEEMDRNSFHGGAYAELACQR